MCPVDHTGELMKYHPLNNTEFVEWLNENRWDLGDVEYFMEDSRWLSLYDLFKDDIDE